MNKRFLILAIIVALLLPQVASAEDTMQRFYLMPLVLVNNTYFPNHIYDEDFNPDGEVNLTSWSAKDYRTMGIVMVFSDITTSDQHNALISFSDVFAFPENIEINPSPSELADLENYLEASFIPANWLSPSDTWREVIRTIVGMFLFMQRLTVLSGSSPLDWVVTLNTQFSDLELDKQDAIVDTYDQLGYDSTQIKSNWTLRIVIKDASDQWGSKPIYFGPVIL